MGTHDKRVCRDMSEKRVSRVQESVVVRAGIVLQNKDPLNGLLRATLLILCVQLT
jgi:hypothetical protein